MTADPSWFFSSLAQSAAALVGFGGGFWVMRLQHYISRWDEANTRLAIAQQRWASVDIEVEFQEREAIAKVPPGDIGAWRTNVDQALDRERGERWNEVRRLLDMQRGESFPAELGYLGVFLVGVCCTVG